VTDPATLSKRARDMQASPIRRLAHLAVAARAAGKTVYALNIGQPDIATPKEILDRLKTYDARNVPYGPSQGLPEFLKALETYYKRNGIDVTTDEIFVTTGGSEAILFVLAAICDPGDEVLVFEPFYTNYNGFGAMVSVRPRPVTTKAEDGYHLPKREAIEARITPKTRAILICSPNNPTGTVYTEEEMEMLGALCRDRGLYLVSDEVYREFAYDGRKQRSALTLPGLDDRAIVVDSLSKRVSLCGARIGCVVSRNKELMATLLKLGQARLCPPTLDQYMATALPDVPASYMRDVLEEYTRRRDLVYDALRKVPGVTVRKPEGAFYLCAKLPVDDAESFAMFLLETFDLGKETVLVSPADGFYATPGLGKDEVRIAYVLETGKLARAMEILTAGLEAYPGRVVASRRERAER
jgi:aspartate aminotransferase